MEEKGVVYSINSVETATATRVPFYGWFLGRHTGVSWDGIGARGHVAGRTGDVNDVAWCSR